MIKIKGGIGYDQLISADQGTSRPCWPLRSMICSIGTSCLDDIDQARHLRPKRMATLADMASGPRRPRRATPLNRIIEALIAEIDGKISDQINVILHAPEFQKLEGSWRGLHFLVRNTPTDAMLKIKIFNIGQRELTRTLRKFRGTAWDQSPDLQAHLRGGITGSWGASRSAS